jgi:hypothetical protein
VLIQLAVPSPFPQDGSTPASGATSKEKNTKNNMLYLKEGIRKIVQRC